jgi:hypothetical protein
MRLSPIFEQGDPIDRKGENDGRRETMMIDENPPTYAHPAEALSSKSR